MPFHYKHTKFGKPFIYSVTIHLIIFLMLGLLLTDKKRGERNGKKILVTLHFDRDKTSGNGKNAAPIKTRDSRNDRKQNSGTKTKPAPSVKKTIPDHPETTVPEHKVVEKTRIAKSAPDPNPADRPDDSDTLPLPQIENETKKTVSEEITDNGDAKTTPVDPQQKRGLSENSSGGERYAKSGSDLIPEGALIKPLSYIDRIRNEIQKHWSYPEAARNKGLTGKVTVRFFIDRNGNLGDINITKSSGYPVLDYAVEKAIKKSAPFERLPYYIRTQVALIELDFKYSLNYMILK